MRHGGNIGYCPDWLAVVSAAHYYGCKPWELLPEIDPYWIGNDCWIEWATTARSAERDYEMFIRGVTNA